MKRSQVILTQQSDKYFHFEKKKRKIQKPFLPELAEVTSASDVKVSEKNDPYGK